MKQFPVDELRPRSRKPQTAVLRFAPVVVCVLIGQVGIAAAVQAAEARRVAEPLVKPAFTPLPPGAIEPAGWLRDWALAAATASPDTWTSGRPPIATPGKASEPARLATARAGRWNRCSYWLDGALRLGYVLHDEALIKKATDRLNLVVDGVNNGGKSFIYWKKEPPDGFNSWACSHMGRALVAWYDASGDKRILGCAGSRLFPVTPFRVRKSSSTTLPGYAISTQCWKPTPSAAIAACWIRCWTRSSRRASMRPSAPGPIAATTRATPYAPTKNSACPSCFIPGPANSDIGRPRIAPCQWVNEQEHAPLRRGFGHGESGGRRGLSFDRNLRRGGRYLVVGCGCIGSKAIDRSATASSGLLQRRGRRRSPGTSRPCATTNRPTASKAKPCRTSSPSAPGKGCLKFTRLGYPPCPLLRRRRQPHPSELYHAHVDGHGGQADWRRPSTVLARCRPRSVTRCP